MAVKPHTAILYGDSSAETASHFPLEHFFGFFFVFTAGLPDTKGSSF